MPYFHQSRKGFIKRENSRGRRRERERDREVVVGWGEGGKEREKEKAGGSYFAKHILKE